MHDPLTKLETKSHRGGIYCPDCGTQNPRNLKFCNGCGKALASVCTQCKKSNPIKPSFCGLVDLPYNERDNLITLFRNIGLIHHIILLSWFIGGEVVNFSVYTHL